MRSFAAAALMGVSATSAFSISDYIMAAGGTPANAAAFGTSAESTAAASVDSSASTEPCAQVSSILASTKGKDVDATLAYDCLRSVPLDTQGGLLQLDGIQTMVQFQTTLAYLKDPPAGYLYPPVDIDAGIAELKANLHNKVYSNEYDFQLAIYSLIASAYDGHFNYIPDIVAVFTFLREEALFSLSADGVSLPDVWLGGPSTKPTDFGNTDEVMLPVTKINHQDVEAWLNEYAAQNGMSQDPDANYNSIFPNIPTLATFALGSFVGSSYYQGPYTTVTFADGTTHQINHTAGTSSDFSGVKDGKTFFDKFCTGREYQQQSSKKARSTPSSPPETSFTPVKPGGNFTAPLQYPDPIVALKDQSVAGYFPEKQDPDLAVLSIPSFQPTDQTGVSFSDTVRTFLATAQKANKKRLMIDLRGNGGGDVLLAYDTFAQIFPSIQPYGGTNFRATPLVHDLGAVVSGFFKNVTEQNATPDDCNNNYDAPLFDYRVSVDEDGKPFSSWDAFFGPNEHHGDNFTTIDRFDLDNFFSTLCTQVSNHGNLTDITPQVFDPEDVVIVQDGVCASTCAVFTEFMKAQAGVKQIVFGGRARRGPMQGVGGVKGANVYTYGYLYSSIEEALSTEADGADRARLNETYGGIIPGIEQSILRAAANDEGPEARVNVRNNIRRGDGDATPLQFVYEAADCRLFYTPEQLFRQELVWKAAYDARWGTGECVPGSVGQPSAEPDYLGIGGPTNASSTVSSPKWGTTGVPLLQHSNSTGVWGSSSSSSGSTSTWGSTKAPTATSSPSPTVTPSQNGAAGGLSHGLAFSLLSALAGVMLLL